MHTGQNQLGELDTQIAELTRFLELESKHVHPVPVSRPTPDQLILFYDRLDEVDNQLCRWRKVQSDIQEQRLRLRDEMVTHSELSIESHEHPYHDTSEIVVALETRIHELEETARSRQQASVPIECTVRLTSLCNEMRHDLQALCEELGRQYRHVRHHGGVAVLKQLRRCYHDMDENVKRLLVRRASITDDIRNLDPAGAEAIVRGDQSFRVCAEQEGHFVARQRFVTTEPIPENSAGTGYRTIYPNLTAERSHLADLQTRRDHSLGRIANTESGIRVVEPERQKLIDERQRLASLTSQEHLGRLREIDNLLHPLETELVSIQVQIETDRPWLSWQPNYLLMEASRHLQNLSNGQLGQIWIDHDQKISVRTEAGVSISATRLSNDNQSWLRLSLSLAAVDQLALRGIRLPMLVEDNEHFVTTHNLVSTLGSFCRSGHQMILLTPNRCRIAQSEELDGTVFELPDSDITSPSWYPETPELPRQKFPLTSRPSDTAADLMDQIDRQPFVPMNTIPAESIISRNGPLPTATVATVNPATFIPTPLVSSPRTACTRDTLLQDIDLVESIYLTPMESLGVYTIGQLLDMDLEKQSIDLERRGFNLGQIDRWQARAWLQVCLPELGASDARVLVGSGIDQPAQILLLDVSEIQERIRLYLESSAGRRSNTSLSQFNSTRLQGWVDRLENDNGWRTYSRSSNPSLSGQDRNSDQWADPINSRRKKASATRRSGKPELPTIDPLTADQQTADQKTSALKFFLSTSDEISAAPSIGARTAEKFCAQGIDNVSDFLNADPVDLAAKFDNRRLSAKVLTGWQHQSRLMCVIPNLRGHDVQILVKCGILDPSELASLESRDLLDRILPFVNSKEGVRMLRNSCKPDLQEVAGWIESASNVRALKAA